MLVDDDGTMPDLLLQTLGASYGGVIVADGAEALSVALKGSSPSASRLSGAAASATRDA